MDGRAALCDFGLSVILDSGPTGFTSFIVGSTLRFKAPEEFTDDLEGGSIPRDVYSYACIYGQVCTPDSVVICCDSHCPRISIDHDWGVPVPMV
jgi:serine/threonine protein kinase